MEMPVFLKKMFGSAATKVVAKAADNPALVGAIAKTIVSRLPTSTPPKTTWDRIAIVLAAIAKCAGRAALWASQHPDVVAAVAAAAGHPEVARLVQRGAAIGGAADQAIEAAIK